LILTKKYSGVYKATTSEFIKYLGVLLSKLSVDLAMMLSRVLKGKDVSMAIEVHNVR
jgi:hypothetical protein